MVASTNQGAKGMDVDIPILEEGVNGDNEILEIEDDCLSLPYFESIESEVEELDNPSSPLCDKV